MTMWMPLYMCVCVWVSVCECVCACTLVSASRCHPIDQNHWRAPTRRMSQVALYWPVCVLRLQPSTKQNQKEKKASITRKNKSSNNNRFVYCNFCAAVAIWQLLLAKFIKFVPTFQSGGLRRCPKLVFCSSAGNAFHIYLLYKCCNAG